MKMSSEKLHFGWSAREKREQKTLRRTLRRRWEIELESKRVKVFISSDEHEKPQ